MQHLVVFLEHGLQDLIPLEPIHPAVEAHACNLREG